MDGISRGGRFDQKHSKMMLVVKGLVVGAFGEGSEDLHTLIHHLATSRVRVAGPQKGKRGQVRSEEAELAITTSFLRRTLSTAGVRAQSKLLLSRLEVIGPVAGANAAAGRRSYALNLERRMANQRRADQLSRLQGKALLRRGQLRLIDSIKCLNKSTLSYNSSHVFVYDMSIALTCSFVVLISFQQMFHNWKISYAGVQEGGEEGFRVQPDGGWRVGAWQIHLGINKSCCFLFISMIPFIIR